MGVAKADALPGWRRMTDGLEVTGVLLALESSCGRIWGVFECCASVARQDSMPSGTLVVSSSDCAVIDGWYPLVRGGCGFRSGEGIVNVGNEAMGGAEVLEGILKVVCRRTYATGGR